MRQAQSVTFSRISIHAAREGGDQVVRCKNCVHFISIHAAREGGDKATTLTQ